MEGGSKALEVTECGTRRRSLGSFATAHICMQQSPLPFPGPMAAVRPASPTTRPLVPRRPTQPHCLRPRLCAPSQPFWQGLSASWTYNHAGAPVALVQHFPRTRDQSTMRLCERASERSRAREREKEQARVRKRAIERQRGRERETINTTPPPPTLYPPAPPPLPRAPNLHILCIHAGSVKREREKGTLAPSSRSPPAASTTLAPLAENPKP